MAGISAILGVVGTVVSAVGTIAAGNAQRAAAEYQAKLYERKANEELAAAQRDADEYQRQKRFVQSKFQANAAASGFDATDTTTLNLLGSLEQRGSYQAAVAQYGGAARQAAYRGQATATRMSGRAAQTGSYFDAAGTILGGFSSLYGKYGGGFAQNDFVNPWATTYAPATYGGYLGPPNPRRG